jgi:hypothetical protein
MMLEDRLRDVFGDERLGVDPPDADALRDAGVARRHRHDRVVVAMCVLVVVVAGAALLANRSSESANVITGPVPATPHGPEPAPNVVRPGPIAGVEGVLSPWRLGRTGVDDAQLVLAFNPLPTSPLSERVLSCPVVLDTPVVVRADRVEVGLVLGEGPPTDCGTVGPPHVVVQLPESLAGRPVFDLAEPNVERNVMDGSTLNVPTVLPGDMQLVEERLLGNPQGQDAWSQSYGASGQGSFVIAQSATHGRALGGAGLAAAAPGDAPVTLEATEPIRTGKVAQLGGSDTVEMTVAVYLEAPDGRVADAALVWRIDGISYALRYRGESGVDLGDLVAAARSMQTA